MDDFRLTIEYLDTTSIVLKVHTDNSIEVVTFPTTTTDSPAFIERAEMFKTMVDFCRRNKIDLLRCKKL